MRPGRLLATAALGGLLGLAPGPARADDAAEQRQRAGEHVKRGDEFKTARAYDKAAAEYLAAYELVPHPELFFNLAQVYRLGGDDARALEYYERYLAVEPDGRASGQARELAAALRQQLAARGGGDGDDDVVIAGGGPAPGAPMRWTGLGAAGLGIVSLAIGIKFGLDAQAISDEITAHDRGWTDELLARQAEGESAETRMFVFTGVGAALVVAGGVLFYLGHRADRRAEPARVTASPWLAPDAAGLALGGVF